LEGSRKSRIAKNNTWQALPPQDKKLGSLTANRDTTEPEMSQKGTLKEKAYSWKEGNTELDHHREGGKGLEQKRGGGRGSKLATSDNHRPGGGESDSLA